MNVVLFLSGDTMGDALAGSGRTLRQAFEKLGLEFVEIRFGDPAAPNLLNQTLSSRTIEFAFSHVGIGADLTAQSSDGSHVNLWAANEIPYISFYGDSPAYFFDRHIMPGPGFACMYAFPEHLRFRSTLPQRNGIIGHTPLSLIDDTPKSGIDFRAKASGKLLFLKNGNDPTKLLNSWRDLLPVSTFLMLTDLAGDLVGRMNADAACDIDASVVAHMRDKGIEVEAATSLRLFFVAQLDDYLRRVKSTSMAEVLRDYPVEIHGFNWDHVDFSGRRARYVHGANFGESKQLIRNALGILDMSPNTALSPHDRPLRAFGLHTLCLTNEQEFFRRHFEQYQSFSFSFDQGSLASKVEDVLSDPKHYIDVGIEVAESFRRQFTPEAFGQAILDLAHLLKISARRQPMGMQDFFVWPPSKLA